MPRTAVKNAVKSKKPVSVMVKVDRELKRQYDEALVRLREATTAGAKGWDERYEAIAEVVEHQPPLYLAGGFSSDREFFKKMVGEDRASVYRNMRIAKYASPDDIEKLTQSRIDAAISWLEAKNGGEPKGRTPVNFEKLKVTLKRDGKSIARPLSELSAAEVREAVRLLKGKQKASKKASAEAIALEALFKQEKVEGATFDVRRNTLVLRVPMEELARAGSALAAYRPPGI